VSLRILAASSGRSSPYSAGTSEVKTHNKILFHLAAAVAKQVGVKASPNNQWTEIYIFVYYAGDKPQLQT